MAIKNFASGAVLYAADVNTYLMNQAVMTFASASARDTALPSPTEGMTCYLLDVNQYQMNLSSTTSSWYPIAGQMPRCELTRTTDFSVSASAYITVTGWTQTELRGGFTESSGVVTVPITGRYNISVAVSWATSSVGSRVVSLGINGTTTSLPGSMILPTTINTQQTISYTGIKLTAADTVRALVYQSTAGALALNGSSYGLGLKFILEYVGP